MAEELGRVLPPALMQQLFSGGVVVSGYDHSDAVIDILAAKKPLPENGRFLEAVVKAGLKRWRNPPPPMPQLFFDVAVTKRLPKRGRVMEAVLQPGSTMEDLMAEEHHGRVLPPPLPRWRNPSASKPQLFSGGGVDVGYDHAAAVIDMLAAKKPLPANGRFLEAVLQAGPTMKELMAAEPGDHLFPPPLPRWRNPPASKPQLFSGGGVDVGYDHATAVIDTLAGKKPLPANGRFLEAVLQAGPTMKELTAAESGDHLFPPPLLRWRNTPGSMPNLFSGGGVDVGYDHTTGVVNSLAGKNPLPEKGRFLEAAEHCRHLPPPCLPDQMNPPQLFSGDDVSMDTLAAK